MPMRRVEPRVTRWGWTDGPPSLLAPRPPHEEARLQVAGDEVDPEAPALEDPGDGPAAGRGLHSCAAIQASSWSGPADLRSRSRAAC